MIGPVRLASGAAAALMVMVLPAAIAHAGVAAGTDSDPANALWDCGLRRVTFTDPAVDALRCMTFTFDVPDDLESAVLYLDIEAPTNSLQDTDSLVVAVGQPFDECSWAQGAMAGCVIVHGGFAGGERSLVVDLLNLGCDASAPVVDQARQSAVRAQIETGVVHVMLQDDTAVNGAWLDLDGSAPAVCGTSVEAVPVAVVQGVEVSAGAGDRGAGATGTALVVAAGTVAGAAAAAAAGSAATNRARVRRMRARIRVERVPDAGRVEIEHDSEPSVSVGVRTWRDEAGQQTLEEIT